MWERTAAVRATVQVQVEQLTLTLILERQAILQYLEQQTCCFQNADSASLLGAASEEWSNVRNAAAGQRHTTVHQFGPKKGVTGSLQQRTQAALRIACVV